MENFIKKLPKIELHAHLNGSLSKSTLQKLINFQKQKSPHFEDPDLNNFSQFNSLDESFNAFQLAHDLVDCEEALKIATENVIREFSEDNVVYLELRSTPRSTERMTKLECLQTIIDTIIACQTTYPEMIVKFLPSINISYGVTEATSNFQLFSDFRKKYPEIVKGIDLSGDPTKGKFADFMHIFKQARIEGFRLALHCAVVKDHNETLEMLKFMSKEDRIGHGTFIEESNEEIWKEFLEKKIPVEICLTSNVLCKSVPSYEEHHITRLMKVGHPFVICTDDCGVFQTSLSNELKICTEKYKMLEDDLVKLTVNANKYSFASDLERQLIYKKIKNYD